MDVIASPPGELFSETNDNSVAILLTYGTTCVLLADDAEAGGGVNDQGRKYEAFTVVGA